jgi:hypothetical protein
MKKLMNKDGVSQCNPSYSSLLFNLIGTSAKECLGGSFFLSQIHLNEMVLTVLDMLSI